MRRRLTFPREVLLVEIERRCRDAQCNARQRISLTRADARSYHNFVCERCERRWDDALSERDIPDWWEELKVTSLEALRPVAHEEAQEVGDVVMRLSDAWQRRTQERKLNDAETDVSVDGGESSF